MQNNSLPKNWILIRGLIRGRYHWKGFENDFKQRLQLENVNCVELAGNGYLNEQQTPVQMAEAIQGLKNQITFDTTEPVGLLGISLGGMLATRWAQMEPQLFSHLVIINSSSSLSPFYKRLLPPTYLSILKMLFQNKAETNEEFILAATSNFPDKWRAILKENTEFLKAHPIQAKNFITQLKLSGQINFNEVPKSKKLILASRQDRLVSVNCSEKIAEAWQCPILYHETAGHDLTFDDGAWVIESILNHFS